MTPFYDPGEMDNDYTRAAGGRVRVVNVPHIQPPTVAAVLLAMLRYGWPVLVIVIVAIIF